jgi:hypothetical protein
MMMILLSKFLCLFFFFFFKETKKPTARTLPNCGYSSYHDHRLFSRPRQNTARARKSDAKSFFVLFLKSSSSNLFEAKRSEISNF